MTIDDLPFVGDLAPGDDRSTATRRILASLREHGVNATGFVVCRGRGRHEAPLRMWLEAGLALANHTTTHRHYDDVGASEWARDVADCKSGLEELVGAEVLWFRYPYLQRGRTAERRDEGYQTLERLGHRLAPVTVDTSDWSLVAYYVRARERGDDTRAAEVGRAYVNHVIAALRHYRRVSRERTGRDVAQVLLLHENALAADFLGEVLTAIAAEGYRFVALEEAMADPVYAAEDGYAGPVGMSWLYRMRPAEPHRWAFDEGQRQAFRARFGGAREAEVRIAPDLVVRPLTGRAWVVEHGRPLPANSLVAEVGDALLLVDTPYSDAATEELLVWLKARFGERRLIAVNTHYHYDALGGNAALAAAGVETWGSDATARLLEERGAAMRSQVLGWLEGREEAEWFTGDLPPAAARAFALDEGLTLRVGSDEIRVVHPGPAHAPDNVAVYLPRDRVLFGGCAVYARERARLGNVADADLGAWPVAIERMRALRARHIVPGHGAPGGPRLFDHTLRVLSAHAAR